MGRRVTANCVVDLQAITRPGRSTYLRARLALKPINWPRYMSSRLCLEYIPIVNINLFYVTMVYGPTSFIQR